MTNDEKERLAFKEGLKKACDEEADGKSSALSNFFAYGLGRNPPKDCDGNHDRTFGFHRLTTILKTFGEADGVACILRMYPVDTDLPTAVKVVFDKELKDIDRSAAQRLARHTLALACSDIQAKIKDVLSLEDDHVLQHALTVLQGECQWCVREFQFDGAAMSAKSSGPAKKLLVLCTCHGDTCDGHATKIGEATTPADAQALIEEDKVIFREQMAEAAQSHYTDRPREIWYDSINGRTYDVVEV